MITARMFQNTAKQYWGFEIDGHAGYAEAGEDIVCAAVSALSLNTVNSIEVLTKVSPICQMEDGFLRCEISELHKMEPCDPKVTVLLDSLALGLQSIAESYEAQYLHVLTIQN